MGSLPWDRCSLSLVAGSLREPGQLEGHGGAWAGAKSDGGGVYPHVELPSAHKDGQHVHQGAQGADHLSGAY